MRRCTCVVKERFMSAAGVLKVEGHHSAKPVGSQTSFIGGYFDSAAVAVKFILSVLRLWRFAPTLSMSGAFPLTLSVVKRSRRGNQWRVLVGKRLTSPPPSATPQYAAPRAPSL
jgi:hypothetical protein